MDDFDSFLNDDFDSFGDELDDQSINDNIGNLGDSSQSNSGFSDDDFGLSNNELQIDESNNQDNLTTAKSKKLAIGLVAGGIIFLIVFFAIINLVSGVMGKSPGKSNNSESLSVNENSSVEEVNKPNNPTNSDNSDNSGWVSFNGDNEVDFNGYTELSFTVTSINHFAKVVSNNNIMVKTVLTGSISGLNGVYEMTVPYDKGSKLYVGATFDISTQLGTTSNGDIVVIGDIQF